MTDHMGPVVSALAHGDLSLLLTMSGDSADQRGQLAAIMGPNTATLDWYRFGNVVYEVRRITRGACPIHGIVHSDVDELPEVELFKAENEEEAIEAFSLRMLAAHAAAIDAGVEVIADSLDPDLINPFMYGPGDSQE